MLFSSGLAAVAAPELRPGLPAACLAASCANWCLPPHSGYRDGFDDGGSRTHLTGPFMTLLAFVRWQQVKRQTITSSRATRSTALSEYIADLSINPATRVHPCTLSRA